MTEMTEIISKSESKIIFDNQFVSEDDVFMVLDGDNVKTNVHFSKWKFGVMKLKINNIVENSENSENNDIENKQKNKRHHYVFTVDCSGSMSDRCNDNRTKMDHIIHTLINMIVYFAENIHLNVSITVFAFDDLIYQIIENIAVNKENLEELIEKVKQIRPKSMTDIEKALVNAKEYILKYCRDHVVDAGDSTDGSASREKIIVTHIFMTDGDATIGNNVPDELKKIIDIGDVGHVGDVSISNVFIGFGVDHNAHLLKCLSSENNNAYYFVDALEKAGLVYGEILHSIIFKILENTTVSVNNGYIYDWKKNIWDTKISIGDLVGDTNKLFHVLSDNPDDFTCLIQSNYCGSGDYFEFTIQSNLGLEGSVSFEDLTKYKYRQKTQELLFEVNEYNFSSFSNFNNNNNAFNFTRGFKMEMSMEVDDETKEIQQNLKVKMKKLLDEMKNYIKTIGHVGETSEDIKFMKLLCDDIYICLQTFNTNYGAMFSCSRQTSQGAQRCYSATQTPYIGRNNSFNDHDYANDDDLCLNTPLKLKRSNNIRIAGLGVNDIPKLFLEQVDDNTNDSIPYFSNNICADDYQVSDQIDNPYSTSSILSLMRSCSTNVDEF
jgi:hypothetical protein